MFRALTLTALVAWASAQSISQQCETTLEAIVGNADAAACLSLSSLVPIITGGTSSIIGPINTWLTNICAVPACSNSTIAAVVQNVTTGCATDLSSLGLSSDVDGGITNIIQQYYPDIRQIVCLKDGNTNCVTQTLTNVQGVTGTLNISNVVQIALNPPTNLPSNVTCTDCLQAAYSMLSQDIPSIVSDAAPALQSQCGATFTNGSVPADIVESATTATASPSSTSKAAALGAAAMLPHGVMVGLGVSGLIIISTMFPFFT